jgi:S1-C subfamily serine protease
MLPSSDLKGAIVPRIKNYRILLCCLAVASSAYAYCAAADKLDAPTADDQATAKRTIAELYKSDYDKAKLPSARVALTKKLIDVGNETKDDSTSQFVLWRIAKDIAIRAGDYDLASTAISKLDDRFNIDALNMKMEALEAIASASEAVPDYKKLTPTASALLDDAISSERFELAERASIKLLEFSHKLQDTKEVTRAEAKKQELEKIETAYKDLAGAFLVLQSQQSDPAANASIGRFRCFIKNDWAKGLPMLARSEDTSLVRIVKRDLSNPEETSIQVALADDWWSVAENEQDPVKNAMQKRAAYWYQKALPKLSGLTKQKAEKRSELVSILPSQMPANPNGSDSQTDRATKENKPKSPSAWAALIQHDAQLCRNAKDALLVYKLFLADSAAPEDAKERVRKLVGPVEVAAAKDYVRFGQKWISREEAKEAQNQAESLVSEGIDLLFANNTRAAKNTLEKASHLDPNNAQADFVLGILYALVGRNYTEARVHLLECARRQPQNVSTLNNLALVEIMLNESASALNHLREAKEIDPAAPELAHNVRKVLSESGLKRLHISTDTESSFSALYGELARSSISDEKNSRGWRYMPPILTTIDSQDEPDDTPVEPKNETIPPDDGKKSPKGKKIPHFVPRQAPRSDDFVILSGGTGFVVQPHFILTNQHVIEDGPKIFVRDPNDANGKQLRAKVVAQSRNPDLAILQCDELSAPPIAVSSHLPGRGTDVMVLGFPEFFRIGTGLKSTRGSIVGLPTAETDGMCLYDAITNHGNSGGPICDNSGHVVAVVRVIFNLTEKLAGGIPSEQVVGFLHDHIPEFHPVEGEDKVLAWPEVDALVSKSTVLVLCRAEKSRFAIPNDDDAIFQSSSKSAQPKTTKHSSGSVKPQPTYIEDDCCVACKGTGKKICPDCQNGTVLKIEKVPMLKDPGTGVEVYTDKHLRVPCKTCDGTGYISCPGCHGSGLE